MERLETIATPSTFVCPDCKGGLWTLSGARPLRLMCQNGHSVTLQSLQDAQSLETNRALWAAIRAVQDRRLMLERSAATLRSENDDTQAMQAVQEARALGQQERLLRQMIEVPPPRTPN